MRQAALFAMAPEAVVENRLAGRRDQDNYAKDRCMIDDEGCHQIEWRRQPTANGRRPAEVQRDDVGLRKKVSEGGSDTSSVHKLAESWSAIVETLNSASKGKSKGKVKKGQWTQESSTGCQWQGTSQRQHAAGNRQSWPQSKDAGRAIEKTNGNAKGKGRGGRKVKGKGKGVTCHVCGGIGHPARLCPSEGWVDDPEQDALEGEDS